MKLLVKILLKEILNGWGDWNNHEAYYISELFPSLIADPTRGSEKEKELLLKIKELVSVSEWENLGNNLKEVIDGEYSIDDFIKGIRQSVSSGDFNKADEFYNQIKGISVNKLPLYEYEKIKNDFIQKIRDDINQFVESGDCEKIDRIHEKFEGLSSELDFESFKRDCLLKKHKKNVADKLNKLENLLKLYKFDEAEKFYFKHSETLKEYDLYENKKRYQEKYKRDQLLAKATSLLQAGDFLNADESILKEESGELTAEYEKIKNDFVIADLRSLEKELKIKEPLKYDSHFEFEDEKAQALSITAKYILVEARAGSGKTETVALKVRQLMKYYDVKSDEFIVLAFNLAAADNFRERINTYCGNNVATKFNTLTFHALARRISNTDKQILKDDGSSEDEDYRQHERPDEYQSEFMQKCYDHVEKKEKDDLNKLFYSFLRAASERKAVMFKDDNEYYLYLRNLKLETIAGEYVKSKREKYIADFIFEHQITKDGREVGYRYEYNVKKFFNIKWSYHPDFSLFFADDKKRASLLGVIEYFGFTKNNPGYPGYFETEKESQDYIHETDEKKELFKKKQNINFVAISADDLRGESLDIQLSEEAERSKFEALLEERLGNEGFIVSRKLTFNEVLGKLTNAEGRKRRLIRQITQFINKAQKLSYDPDKIKQLAEKERTKDNPNKRNEYFVRIAYRVFREYQCRLGNKEYGDYTDFDHILIDAINKIKEEGGQCMIRSSHGEGVIGKIKYILIDEYQDFSELFYKLINAIRIVNDSVSVFCVGDNWQAINAFAGSDLKYFDNFEREYFKDGRRASLLINHRSLSRIINYSNLIMYGRGEGGLPKDGKGSGEVHLMQAYRVELRDDQEGYGKDEKYRSGARFLAGREDDTDNSVPLKLARYMKSIEQLILINPDRKIVILFRDNKFYGVKKDKIINKISEWVPNPVIGKKEKRDVHLIESSTAHSYKGQERDVVILVGASRGNFPKFHPDNELQEILGVTWEKIKEDERRLFYVANTRAKEKLYLLYDEEDGISDFVPSNWSYNIIDNI